MGVSYSYQCLRARLIQVSPSDPWIPFPIICDGDEKLTQMHFSTGILRHRALILLLSHTHLLGWASQAAQLAQHSAVQETQVQSLGQEGPLEKEMATHSSILAWQIPWTKKPGGLQSMGSQRVEHD